MALPYVTESQALIIAKEVVKSEGSGPEEATLRVVAAMENTMPRPSVRVKYRLTTLRKKPVVTAAVPRERSSWWSPNYRTSSSTGCRKARRSSFQASAVSAFAWRVSVSTIRRTLTSDGTSPVSSAVFCPPAAALLADISSTTSATASRPSGRKALSRKSFLG